MKNGKKELDIINEFLDANPEFIETDIEFRADGRLEWFCEHGIGHTVYSKDNFFSHGCDGCCRKVIPLNNILEHEHEIPFVDNSKNGKKKVYISPEISQFEGVDQKMIMNNSKFERRNNL